MTAANELRAFREFLDRSSGALQSQLPDTPVFSGFKFRRESNESAALHLRGCVLRKVDMAGHFFWMKWSRVTADRIDLSHTGGRAHWTECLFRGSKLGHLMARVSAADCVFESCDLWGAVLEDPLFLACTFRKMSLKGLALRGAIFVDCEFDQVDLADSRWSDTKCVEIRGTWSGAAAELDSSAGARLGIPAG